MAGVIFAADLDLADAIIGNFDRPCDLVIAPDGQPYLYRWHIVKTPMASCYFHIQVRSDPERPLHDHPWDNTSSILVGGYDERINEGAYPGQLGKSYLWRRMPGETIFRKAEWGHRLVLPDGVPYTMSLFSTGMKRREWGFWYPDRWVSWKEVCQLRAEGSVHIGRN